MADAVRVYELVPSYPYFYLVLFCVQGDELKYQFVPRTARSSQDQDAWIYYHYENQLVSFGLVPYRCKGKRGYAIYVSQCKADPDAWSSVKLGQDFAFRFCGQTLEFDYCNVAPTAGRVYDF